MVRPFLAILALAITATVAPAQLHFPATTIDAGSCYTGQPLVRKFEFVNNGTVPVEITEITGSCACAKPRLAQRLFLPRDKGSIEVEVHTLGLSAGPNSWTAKLQTQTGAHKQEIVLRLDALLVSEVYCKPAVLQLLTSEAFAAEFSVHDDRPRPFTITGVRTSNPGLAVQMTQVGGLDARPAQQWKFTLNVGDDYPEGRREEIVSVYTSDAAYAELKVPVTIVKLAKQRVTATPAGLVLSAVKGQAVPSRVLLLRDAENQAVQVEKITADDPAISASWAAGPGEMATVKVRVDAGKVPAEGLRSAIHVEVGASMGQVVTIPVEVRVGQ